MSTFDETVAALLAGEPVIVPTDTVYGIAVDPSRPGATDRLFILKARPTDVALPVLVADTAQAFSLVEQAPDVAVRLARRFWPGALTMVLPRRRGLGFDLGGADDATIGVRVPGDEIVRRLASVVGPLATTSANRHGHPTPETAAGAAEEFGGAVVAVLDDGRRAGAPSTVVACGADGVTVLREGRIPAAAVHAAGR